MMTEDEALTAIEDVLNSGEDALSPVFLEDGRRWHGVGFHVRMIQTARDNGTFFMGGKL